MSYLPSAVSPGVADNDFGQVDYLSSSTTPTQMSPTNSTTDMKILESVSMYSGQTEQMTFASSAEGGRKGGAATADIDTVPMTVAVSMGEPSPPKTRARSIPIIEAAGGTDKCPKSGMRRDTIPMVEAIVSQDFVSEVLQFHEEFAEYDEKCGMTEEEVARRNNEGRANNDAIRSVLLGEDGSGAVAGVIVRCNPGTVSTNTQVKLDAMLVELDQKGVRVMSHPEVNKRMGAKDALVKIRHLRCGLLDTEVYYDGEALEQGFRKSIAFRPRVIKQNRGSQGEGIWIVKLKDESTYCQNYGDAIAAMDTPLILMEANDNHVEEHTVGEFLEFCLNGRTEKSGQWRSTGRGRYLDGGVEAGAMLVDQRFLPRIVEGEVRCMMIGPNLVELIHKKPKEGGLSATLQSGAVYTNYKPDAPEFASLVENFQHDMPKIMSCFGMEDQPLPLLWTADYIFGEPDATGRDTFYIGEFNCTCVGITQQLILADLVARTAIDTVMGGEPSEPSS